MATFRGAFTALITPMRDGEIDDAALHDLVEAQIAAGIDGLVPCGTTGEAATLSIPEHLHVVDTVVKAVRGRVPVLAGAGSNNTRQAIDTSKACFELGADGTLHVTPYYNKPPQSGLLAHFRAIADATPLPIILYNVPGRTACDLKPETVAALARHERIVGIKEATGDMARASRIREMCGPDFDLLSGDDFSLLPFLAAGGDGVISVVSNVIPRTVTDLCKAAREGRLADALKLHNVQLPLTRALFLAPNPMPVKAAMAMLGRCRDDVRLPLHSLDPDSPEGRALSEALKNLGEAQ
ncbi:MAG: 4-hydroxy-tetrahydrodipicolinate synthase [Myxococcales bacterium]|nr:4-hydroxy-tetrahydrodipicolinate synthase [Myxococcales bacterium]